MRRQRAWFQSGFCAGTYVYIERIVADYADGMPRQETNLLATVYRNHYQFEAVVRQPEEDVFLPGFTNENAAMTAVCNFLSKMEKPTDHATAQLL